MYLEIQFTGEDPVRAMARGLQIVTVNEHSKEKPLKIVTGKILRKINNWELVPLPRAVFGKSAKVKRIGRSEFRNFYKKDDDEEESSEWSIE